jgi:hypothetical protein
LNLPGHLRIRFASIRVRGATLLAAALSISLVASACGANEASAEPAISRQDARTLVRLFGPYESIIIRKVEGASADFQKAYQRCPAVKQGPGPSEKQLLILRAAWILRTLPRTYASYHSTLVAKANSRNRLINNYVEAIGITQNRLAVIGSGQLDICTIILRWKKTGYDPGFPVARSAGVGSVLANNGRIIDATIRQSQTTIRTLSDALVSAGIPRAQAIRFRVLSEPFAGLG